MILLTPLLLVTFYCLTTTLKLTSIPKLQNLSDLKLSEISNLLKNKIGLEDFNECVLFAEDYSDSPTELSNMLQNDFLLSVSQSHMIRSVLLEIVRFSRNDKENKVPITMRDKNTTKNTTNNHQYHSSNNRAKSFKEVTVNSAATKRRRVTLFNYGLTDYETLYPTLYDEIENKFVSWMTNPSETSQTESTLRPTTAEVYVRHVRLFLGWYFGYFLDDGSPENKHYRSSVDLTTILPTTSKSAIKPILQYIIFLRTERSISTSYEANLLRGLTKLCKFRFRNISKSDPNYGEMSFDDVEVIRELRKLHRDANRKQKVAPRSSDEDKKWLNWDEFLSVVRSCHEELSETITKFNSAAGHDKTCNNKKIWKYKGFTGFERKIATLYQYYLVLSIFSCVPDRQRTLRELEIGRTFVKNAADNTWVIKHGPDDYKTGKAYGDRPPMVLPSELTPDIDEFLNRWRPCLSPRGDHFFVQSRTGKAFTQDSVYSIVSRQCFKYTGKKTNPHLLRDMIVTHVRDSSDASEKELEALALFMGHSIAMQRSSYDRRTLEQKVAPAVNLLQSVNNKSKNKLSS